MDRVEFSGAFFIVIAVIIGVPLLVLSIWALISLISMSWSQKAMARELERIGERIDKISSMSSTAQNDINAQQEQKLSILEMQQKTQITQLENQILQLNSMLADIKADIKHIKQ